MKRRTSPVALILIAACSAAAVLLALRTAPATADEALLNGGFETWSGSAPANWTATAVQKVTSPSASGFAASVASGGSLVQVAPVAGGAFVTLHVSVASASGSANATATIAWLDSAFLPVGGDLQSSVATSSDQFTTLLLTGTAPATAAYARVRLSAQGGAVVFDNASLAVTVPEPTSTPTSTPAADTPSPSPTPTEPSPTSSPTPATRTPTTSPTPARTPTPSSSPPPPGSPPSDGGGAVPPPSAYDGGLLANGGFELTDGVEPLYWSKFGGDMFAVPSAHRGSLAASLLSSTASTKWIYQAVAVTPGAWYEASVYALMPSGGGEAFVRISWYGSANGTGSALDSADSEVTTSSSWTLLTTGPIQAPSSAFSARFRLVLRPDGPSSAAFDDAMFVPAAAPPVPTPTPTSAATATTAPGGTASTIQPSGSSTAVAAAPARPPAAARSPGPLAGPADGPRSLRISELLPDPSDPGRDASYEWVELANTGSEPIDLAGWQLGDAKELDTLPSFVIPPGGLVVVAASAAHFDPSVTVVRVPDGEIGNGLNNAGDALRLLAPGGIEVDALSYGDDSSVFAPPPAAPATGLTLGALELAADPGAENWAETERPTPGEPNRFRSRAKASQTAPSKGGSATPAPSGLAANLDVPVREGGGGTSWVPLVIFAAAAGAGGATLLPYLNRALRRRHHGD